jgi:hypothetical protein
VVGKGEGQWKGIVGKGKGKGRGRVNGGKGGRIKGGGKRRKD